MRNLKYYLKIFFALTLLFMSCEEQENLVYDRLGGQELLGFASSSYTLPIVIDSEGSVDITIDVSNVSTSDRTFTISVVEDETTVAPEVYSLPSSVVLPAGEHNATFTITGEDIDVETTPETLTIELTGSEGGAISVGKASVSVFQVCPIEDGFFTGDYRITTLAGSGVFGCPVFPENGIVTLNATSDLSRSFTAAYILDCNFGNFPTDFTFTLVCNEIVVDYVDTGVGCSGNTVNLSVGPSEFVGTYNPLDDSSFTLILTDNVDSDCGGGPVNAAYTFTKI
jgi:hypothetical protein